jgi:hypothetical protein
MAIDKPARRMTLRQLLTHSEKCSRDLIEHLHSTLLAQVSDFRDLSRPVRRRSHYPTVLALQNGLRRLVEASEQVQVLIGSLSEHLDAMRDHAQREQTARR